MASFYSYTVVGALNGCYGGVHIYHVDITEWCPTSQKSPTSSLYDVLMLRYGLFM